MCVCATSVPVWILLGSLFLGLGLHSRKLKKIDIITKKAMAH